MSPEVACGCLFCQTTHLSKALFNLCDLNHYDPNRLTLVKLTALALKDRHLTAIISPAHWKDVGRWATVTENLILELPSSLIYIEFANKLYRILKGEDSITKHKTRDFNKLNVTWWRQEMYFLVLMDLDDSAGSIN